MTVPHSLEASAQISVHLAGSKMTKHWAEIRACFSFCESLLIQLQRGLLGEGPPKLLLKLSGLQDIWERPGNLGNSHFKLEPLANNFCSCRISRTLQICSRSRREPWEIKSKRGEGRGEGL